MEAQRRVPRYDYRLMAMIQAEGQINRTTTHNIGRHGIFAASYRLHEINEPVRVSIILPPELVGPNVTVKAMGVVAWGISPRQALVRQCEPGMGIRFVMLGANDKARWDAIIDAIEAGTLPKTYEPTSKKHVNEVKKVKKTPPTPPFQNKGDIPRYLIRAPDAQFLQLFGLGELSAGQMFLRTPLLREAGDHVQVVLIHPTTDAEFPLEGDVVKAIGSVPLTRRGMLIRFPFNYKDIREDFAAFIKNGRTMREAVRMVARASA